MIRVIGAAFAATCLFGLALAHPSQAQHIVYDPRAYAQMAQEARTTLEQLRALQAQVEQGQRLFDSLNAVSDVNTLARELGLPEVRSPLPDLDQIRKAANGDLSALGDLAERATEIRDETRIYTPIGPGLSPAETYYRDSLERSGARTARDLALADAIGQGADRRRDGLETLRQALDGAPNARAVLDLEARLAAEQALIQNEQVRLQGLALAQAAEDRLATQQERERAEAARAKRMQAWAATFQ
ncbi:type IV secretion system protein [Brevundimonas nasdae]|uniref:Type IV secretion system protein n=1 Tax=Brevundimonas nasdae TaxID=172043 RepID=A0ABX8TJQ6_9CAUL|nr:type IV secretion system protein [Brevundimonas nasdae]QYC11456.1 type IV secretion system protein [Brevundimonas nasdae]QYC14244.1 type IV secretion system protein [Brevundimonas nasdae]